MKRGKPKRKYMCITPIPYMQIKDIAKYYNRRKTYMAIIEDAIEAHWLEIFPNGIGPDGIDNYQMEPYTKNHE